MDTVEKRELRESIGLMKVRQSTHCIVSASLIVSHQKAGPYLLYFYHLSQSLTNGRSQFGLNGIFI
jgi:hypothetical protein